MKKKISQLNISLTGPAVYWIATMIANIFNWLFNLQAGRTLTKEQFGVLSVFLSFQYLASVPSNALSTTVSRFTAYYIGKGEQQKHFYFFRQYWWLAWGSGILALALAIVFREGIERFFGIDTSFLMLIFAPLLVPLFLVSFEKGNLAGQLAFSWVGSLLVVESITKFSFLIFFKGLPFSPLTLAVASLPVSVGMAWFISLLISRSFHPLPGKEAKANKKLDDTYRFLGNSIFASLGAILIYNIDILLVKHYFTAYEAGVYSTLSLLGKTLYFGAGSLISLLIPLTARAQAKNSSGLKPFLILLSIVSVFGMAIWLTYLLIPKFVVGLLLTNKGFVALPYLSRYTLAMFFLVLASCFSAYNLAKKNYTPARLIVLAGVIEGVLITLFHSSLDQVVNIVTSTLFGLLLVILATDLMRIIKSTFVSNITSFLKLFSLKNLTESKNKKCNVLIFNWRDLKHVHSGGAEVYIDEIAKRLVKNNYKVTIFTANDGKNKDYEKTNEVEVIRRGGFVTVYIWAAVYYLLRLRNKFDIIIDCENGVPFFSPIYSGKPVVLLVHHVHQDVVFQNLVPPFSWIANFLETYLMPKVYRNSQVVAVSPSTAEELSAEINMEDAQIISNGVDTKKYQPDLKAKYPLISYVGRLKKYKSVEVLLAAFAKLHEDLPTARLVIAGDGDYKSNLEQKAQKLNLGKSATFLGKVSEEQKVKLLSQSWLMVHPSFMEGWGITCLEANACGTPVLASNVAGLKDAVFEGASGFLFEYGNDQELYKKMKELISDRKQLTVLGETAKAWSKRYSWDTQSKKFMDLIESILANEKAGAYGGSYWGIPFNIVSRLMNFDWARRES